MSERPAKCPECDSTDKKRFGMKCFTQSANVWHSQPDASTESQSKTRSEPMAKEATGVGEGSTCRDRQPSPALSQPDVSPVSHTFPSSPDHVREVTEMVQPDASPTKGEPMNRTNGWDERDYKLWSAIGVLQSYGRINRIDHLVSLHEVEELLRKHAEERWEAKNKATDKTSS